MFMVVVNLIKAFIIAYFVFVFLPGAAPGNLLLLVCIIGLPLAIFLLFKTKLAPLLDKGLGVSGDLPDSGTRIRTRRERIAWFSFGLFFLSGCLVILEIRQPFFFSQDDNFSENLPLILQGCRSIKDSVLCTWNPYQLLGAPTISIPQSLLGYPPVYPAYFIAHSLLQNEFLTGEILCIGHVLFAFVGMYWLVRLLGLRPMLASVGSLSMTLSGFGLIIGRSWLNAYCTFVWAIFLMVSIVWLQQKNLTRKWIILTAICIGIPFYAGHVQFWIYSLFFFCLAAGLMVLTNRMPLRKAAWIVPALMAGLSIAAPLLVIQGWEVTRLSEGRVGNFGQAIQGGFRNLFIPCPLAQLGPDPVESYGPATFGSINHQFMGQFYYSGTLFYGIAFLIMVFSVPYRWSRRTAANNIWLICAFVALVLACGSRGVLWSMISKLPIFDKFTGPFKLLGFLNLFVIIGAGLFIERLLQGTKRQRFTELLLAVPVCLLLLYHCILPLPAFYSFGSKPYLPLPKEMTQFFAAENTLSPQRVLGIAPMRSTNPTYAISLMHNLPSVYRLLSFDGYDPLLVLAPENKKAGRLLAEDPLRALRAYGIRWVVLHRLAVQPVHGPNAQVWFLEDMVNLNVLAYNSRLLPSQFLQSLTPRLQLPEVCLLEVTNVSPLAFLSQYPDAGLPIQFNGRGVQVDVSGLRQGGLVVVNFLNRPWMHASVDGRPVRIVEDEWCRIRASVPSKSQRLEVRYMPPWRLSFGAAGLLLLGAVIGGWTVSLLNVMVRTRNAG